MKLKKKNILYTLLLMFMLSASPIKAYAQGTVIAFSNLDNLLWSIIATIQYYTLPVMTIALVFLGIKLVASGDDTASKDIVKSWMLKILIGGVLIFGAAIIAGLIKTAVGG